MKTTVPVQTAAAGREDKAVMGNMLELYNHDLSEYEDSDLDQHGLYGYDWLDAYWTDPTRHPFLIRVDGRLAGLALVNRHSNTGADIDYAMAEFFVVRRYRRQGVGRRAALDILQQLPGRWEITILERNQPALAFWQQVVAQHTGGCYEQLVSQSQWTGPVLRFVSGGPGR